MTESQSDPIKEPTPPQQKVVGVLNTYEKPKDLSFYRGPGRPPFKIKGCTYYIGTPQANLDNDEYYQDSYYLIGDRVYRVRNKGKKGDIKVQHEISLIGKNPQLKLEKPTEKEKAMGITSPRVTLEYTPVETGQWLEPHEPVYGANEPNPFK